MHMENQELSIPDIINLIEAGKTVQIPCSNLTEVSNLRNNISSRLYKMRQQIRGMVPCDFDSLQTRTILDDEGNVFALRFKLAPKQQAKFSCVIITDEEPEAATEQANG